MHRMAIDAPLIVNRFHILGNIKPFMLKSVYKSHQSQPCSIPINEWANCLRNKCRRFHYQELNSKALLLLYNLMIAIITTNYSHLIQLLLMKTCVKVIQYWNAKRKLRSRIKPDKTIKCSSAMFQYCYIIKCKIIEIIWNLCKIMELKFASGKHSVA